MSFVRQGSDLRGLVGSERGSVLVLGLGFIGVVLLAISVVTDASMAFLQRQLLQSRADAAVLAGVQEIDLNHYYAHGATTNSRLLPSLAGERAREQLQHDQASNPIPGLSIVRLEGSPSELTAEIAAPVRTVFWPIAATISVRSSASLDYVG